MWAVPGSIPTLPVPPVSVLVSAGLVYSRVVWLSETQCLGPHSLKGASPPSAIIFPALFQSLNMGIICFDCYFHRLK